MVVLLLWRIFRIINALMMHKQHQYELRISMQKRTRRLLGRKLEIIQTEKEMHEVSFAVIRQVVFKLKRLTGLNRKMPIWFGTLLCI
ncbi:hypothetical protein P879_05679 [Paragonimus westermani]|uniref:Uncharacterized protein n=1 Tax=Paragonimus westermani TaxID=34504 RepID=A0A8T0DAZ2_9TREM|nr:hypothetical protein P879_05679 [Paragonimus westermani]